MSDAVGQEAAGLWPEAERRLGHLIGGLARTLALAGGLVLVGLVVLTVASVAGRSLIAFGLRPVSGDFELVEAGCAFAIFAFLPWCQYQGGHVTVDILSDRFSPRIQMLLTLVGNLLMTVVAALLAWRLYLGTLEKQLYLETTFILQMPVWWGYALALIGAVLFVLVAAYTVWRSLNRVLQGGGAEPGP
jgi:TRAP-type C4-dicarboxylate transport system permease small subunit